MKRIAWTSSIAIVSLGIGCQTDEADDLQFGVGDSGGTKADTGDTDDDSMSVATRHRRSRSTGGTEKSCHEGEEGCACQGGDTCFDLLICSHGQCVPNGTSMGGQGGVIMGNAGEGNDGGSNDGSGGDATKGNYCEHAACVVVPPTNQVSCYNESGMTSCPDFPCQEDGSPQFCGQDVQYPSETRNFTCYDAGGGEMDCSELIAEGETVVDSLTDLRWQRSYQSELTQDEAVAYCEGLSASSYATFDDWRLPEIHELLGMFDYGGTKRSFDPVAFPDPSEVPFWSATVDAEDQSTLFLVSAPDQVIEANDTPLRARCVRGPTSAWPMEAGVHEVGFPGKKSMLDRTTGLVWSPPSSQKMNWSDALHYCEGLARAGHNHWRLPTIQQLLSAAEYRDWGFKHPFLTSSSWSSTSDPTHPSEALVSSASGRAHYRNKILTATASCVQAP